MHSCKIYVGNLAWATDENALGSHFNSVGRVNEAVVMRSDGRSRGFGFVTFTSPEEAERAIATMNDTELHGRRVRVNVANQQVRTGASNSNDPYPSVRANPSFDHPITGFPEGVHPYAGGPYGGYPAQHPAHPGTNFMYGVNPGMNYAVNATSRYDAGPGEVVNQNNPKGGGHNSTFYPAPASYGYPPVGYGPPPY